jgi:very-short-patch-repair endonuclease
MFMSSVLSCAVQGALSQIPSQGTNQGGQYHYHPVTPRGSPSVTSPRRRPCWCIRCGEHHADNIYRQAFCCWPLGISSRFFHAAKLGYHLDATKLLLRGGRLSFAVPFSLLAIIIAAAVVLGLLKQRAAIVLNDGPWPFYAKKPLSQPEQVLYHRLIDALPGCLVLAQVQLSRVLGVKKGFRFNEWNNRINRLSLDFLVCLKDSTVVAAIELDDQTHEKGSRKDADARKAKALTAAGIQLLRWNVKALPDEATIRQAIVK